LPPEASPFPSLPALSLEAEKEGKRNESLSSYVPEAEGVYRFIALAEDRGVTAGDLLVSLRILDQVTYVSNSAFVSRRINSRRASERRLWKQHFATSKTLGV